MTLTTLRCSLADKVMRMAGACLHPAWQPAGALLQGLIKDPRSLLAVEVSQMLR